MINIYHSLFRNVISIVLLSLIDLIEPNTGCSYRWPLVYIPKLVIPMQSIHMKTAGKKFDFHL